MSQSNNDAGAIKDLGRDGRLSFRNFAEHQLRKEFKADAMQKCDVQINAFASCAKEEGVMVVFRCNEFKRAVNDCMAVYNSNDRFEVYKREHMGDLENKVPGQIKH